MQAPPRWARARPPADLAPPRGTTASAAAAAGAAHPNKQRRRRSRAASFGGAGEAQTRRQAAAALPVQQQQQQQQQKQRLLRLFYETSWPSAILHGSVNGGAWRDLATLRPVASGGGALLVAEVELGAGAASASPAPLLEFVVTDPSRQHWDKPPGDEGNYVVAGAATTTTASAFTLRSGALSPVPQTPPGVLLVSDLDGTMIGKHDQETARLKRWWEREQVPRGGVLCFSSGRSLASIRRLLDEDKRGVLAHPDVVVGAVGTRVYWHERATPAAGGGRAGFPTTNSNGKSGHGHGGGFVEDAQWLAELSSGGWDAPAAREAAYAALARAGKEAMHFLPPEDQSELKVSCGVRDGALARVLEDLQSGLAKHGATSLQGAQIIVSGHGGWRYVDVVPSRAGKLAALEHVRLSGGFAPDCTVAAGDSGNDVAMLAGKKNLAVVVGNAQPDARAWAEEQQAREREEGGLAVGAAVAVASGNGNGNGARPRQKDRLYRATGHEAAGILEALEYWGLKEKGEEDG